MSNAPQDFADAAAEAIRGLNHASWSGTEELTYLGDAYEVVASLKVLAQRLPQCFEQLSHFLVNLTESGAVTADYGVAGEHLAEARSALTSGVLVAQTLAEFLDHAHNSLAPLGYNTRA
ncbi:hypothetical protein [Streptomyces sp. SID9124]|uniref:hypothetical protein n=1 Tax=Streptomyces sp. SID9124 TaxID=2706108 RepID=UPI0013E09822|nr:hypothetical protein [Streptomyces sp. SID9124]NED11273.1 hypothetical protein [Streptomyces sp. SID9124]